MADQDTPAAAPVTLDGPAEAPAVFVAQPDPVPEAKPPVTERPTTTEVPPARPASDIQPEPRSGGFGRFVGFVLGGAVAAGLGFGLAAYGVREGWPMLAPPATGVAEDVAALRAELAQLALQSSDDSRLAAVEQKLTDLPTPATDTAQITALEQRIAALEALPPGAGAAPAALSEMQAQISSLNARLVEQQGAAAQISAEIEAQVQDRLKSAETEAETMRAEAEALRKSAETRAAVLGLQSALDTGAGAESAALVLQQLGLTMPDALSALIAAPISLPQLQDSFAPAARAALAASLQAQMGETMGERLSTFLFAQTGARSLTPRDGSDPDAVLSRIEDRLRAGDVAGARAQIAELPEPGQQALAEWATEADRYSAGQAALADLLTTAQ